MPNNSPLLSVTVLILDQIKDNASFFDACPECFVLIFGNGKIKHHAMYVARAPWKGRNIRMFVQNDSTRSIARKLAREILPQEIEAVAAAGGTVSLDCNGSGCTPGDVDEAVIA